MANNTTLIYTGAALASFYFLTRKETPEVPPLPNELQIDILPSNDGGPTIQNGGNVPITGIEGTHIPSDINLNSTPNFSKWNRAEWTAFFLAHYNEQGIEQASQTLWNYWNDARNDYSNLFPTLDSFIFNLSSNAVSSNNTIGEIITANSVPVYGTIANRWNNIHYWTCNEWIQWYTLNLQAFGTAASIARFIDAWNHDDNNSILSWEAMGILCGYDCDFINYFRSKGLDVANWGAENTCTFVSIPSNLIDATAAVSQGVKNTANTVSFLAPIVIISLTGLFLYAQYQKVN